ncbi:WecB/TagA/CpsF family glycosyltransferase [Aquicoccus porphyridii]|uniref:WecB/TagA/CpsF family glycosyltransferase n=1 Tax=Aquicoccus porphyridii TaxID=1852029 RepID=UPI00273FC489|nr:WecB/TagA/CpsF family glycosyltransferase [Aquicoccus porphyridii]
MKIRVGEEEIAVNLPDADALLEAVRRRMQSGEGFALATINLDHLVKLRGDSGFRAAYRAQDFVVADGNPIVWLGRLAGERLSLVPGSDMVMPLARLAAEEGVKLGLVGSTEDSLSAAGAALETAVPGLEIAARIAPPMGFDPDGPGAGEILRDLQVAGVGLVFLALGAPKQERLAARGRADTPGIGFASIGAGLDFLSGAQRRAPRWVRAIAMEWAWRMLSAPARLMPRYARCFAILPGHMWRALRMRWQDR